MRRRPAAPLPVLYSDDIEETLAAVQAAGGVILKPIFAFPGGRRFHFRDPAGNELAVWGPDFERSAMSPKSPPLVWRGKGWGWRRNVPSLTDRIALLAGT